MALSPSVEVPTVSAAMRTAASSAPAVQFDDTCVVIPDPVAQSRMPRLVKKSYSLPLWRRRQNSNPPPADAAEAADSAGVSITVPLPSFSKSRSPTRGEQAHQPLVSCLVNGPSPAPRRHARRPSLPLPLPPRPDAVTVPLRACCRECYPITEECLREDAAWEEKFTRGARRRRNSSAEAHAHAHAARHRKVCDDVPGFESVVFADEVDKRRSLPPQSEPEDDDVEQLGPSFSRRVQCAEKPPPPRTAVIAEEAEEHLFPLPSPSASSPPLHACADGDLFTQSPDASHSVPPRAEQSDDDGDAPRESVYLTPDASPAPLSWAPTTPSAQSSREDSADGDDSDMPLTPPSAHHHAAAAPAKHGIPNPPARPDALYDDSLIASFAFVDSPPLDLHSGASPSGSPELSASPRRRHFMHMPNLPGPGSFLRAGADLFKGVGGLGGPVPLSV